jgi:2',3'-cyclic-nucleotide 2'-phosphodiesterase (5'-nucleotidase family)
MEIKPKMRNLFTFTQLFRALSLLAIFTFTAPVLLAQTPAPAIEPCPATPSPKPGAFKTTAPTKVNANASQTQIDSNVAGDPEVEKMLAPYSEKVRALSVVLGTLEGNLKKESIGAGTLGNFVTDGMLAEARRKTGKNIVLAIANAGGLRKNEILAGQLTASDIFELLPFENVLITLDVTGVQLLKIVQIGTRDAQSGARIKYRWNEQNRTEFISAGLVDSNGTERNIDPNAVYTIVTIDYLYNLKSGSYAVLQEGKNLTPVNETIRDAMMQYVKAETAAGRAIRARLDDRFVQVGPGPKTPEDPPND